MEDLKEFIDDTEALALAKAAQHYSVSADELDARTVPQHLEVSNLAGRVIVLATVKGAPAKVGPTSEFVRDLLAKLPLDGPVEVSETGRDGRISVRVEGGGFATLANAHEGLVSALGHLAERAAEKLAGEGARVQLDVPGFREARRGEGRRDEGRRGDRGGRGERSDRGRGRDGGGGGRGRERSASGGRGGGRRDDRRSGGGERGRGQDRRGSRDDGDSPSNPALEQAAREAGERVRDSGEAQTLEPMNSRDRWIVHNALKEVGGVSSESVGDGRTKQVKIVPA